MSRRSRNNPVLDGLQAFQITYGLTKDILDHKGAADAYKSATDTTEQASGEEALQHFQDNFVPQEGGPATAQEYLMQNPGIVEGLAGRKAGVEMGGKMYDQAPTNDQKMMAGLQGMQNYHASVGNSDKATEIGMKTRQMRSADINDAAGQMSLDRAKREQDVTDQIRVGGTEGLKNTKDLRSEEKMFNVSKGMYETALKLNRPDLATGYFNQMTQARDVLLANANERAERVYRSTGGNISGFVDSYNKYVADGQTIDEFKRNDDGSHTFAINDGTGKTRAFTVPKEKLGEYLTALRDPKRIAEIEQKRAEILFKAQTDAQEKLNTPVAVGKDQTLIIPGTGKTFAPGGGQRGFDPKESGSVLDDITKIFTSKYGKVDPNNLMAPKGLSDEGLAKSALAQRLFIGNRSLPPAVIAEIADNGKVTTGEFLDNETGKYVNLPAISHNGRVYRIGGNEYGTPEPVTTKKESNPSPPTVATTGVGTRTMTGKIGQTPAPGLQRVPEQNNSMQVSRADQSSRDVEAGKIRVSELGGVARAQKELGDIDHALSNKRLDGTQRRILQSERDLLAAGIASQS